MTDLVKRLRARADHIEFNLDPEQATEHWLAVAEVVGALREAADALEQAQARHTTLTGVAADYAKERDALKASRDATREKLVLAEQAFNSCSLTVEALKERVKKLEAVAEAARFHYIVEEKP